MHERRETIRPVKNIKRVIKLFQTRPFKNDYLKKQGSSAS